MPYLWAWGFKSPLRHELVPHGAVSECSDLFAAELVAGDVPVELAFELLALALGVGDP